ncbi:SH3 domain-containing protein [Streptomyces sp. TP-A0874]|uniref:SH3 domain-containing protein n=1 Tax=Streptomyces sp. TP-A0874 TaxID=549819 RepID=UPI000853EEA3|nr:SH3 domain-containing protein [Streptomyces sp. TP-A0874]
MLQSKFSKLALCAASGAIAAATMAGPAFAAEAPDVDAARGSQSMDAMDHGRHHGKDHKGHHKLYKGRVIARIGLNVRNKPTRHHSRVIGSLHKGQIVLIECKVRSRDVVDGNPLWYKLADGKWAWASARYIENIGPAPRWC